PSLIVSSLMFVGWFVSNRFTQSSETTSVIPASPVLGCDTCTTDEWKYGQNLLVENYVQIEEAHPEMLTQMSLVMGSEFPPE
ncbi:hypothetical protein HAX54_048516, partial [Datura stramonium]|nr:hypothetical protein [Datura stramonium]